MLSSIFLCFFILLESWEVNNPQELVVAFVDTKAISHMQTQCAQDCICNSRFVSCKEQKIAWFNFHFSFESCKFFVCKELDNWRLFLTSSSESNPSHALCAVFCSNVSKLLDIATAPVASAFAVNSFNNSAALSNRAKYLEVRILHDVSDVVEFHAETNVRAVAAEAVHCLVIWHARKWGLKLNSSHRKCLFENVFSHCHNVVLINETHLNVELSELRLTVGTKILIAEAFCDLVVTLNSTCHQHLFELLR